MLKADLLVYRPREMAGARSVAPLTWLWTLTTGVPRLLRRCAVEVRVGVRARVPLLTKA